MRRGALEFAKPALACPRPRLTFGPSRVLIRQRMRRSDDDFGAEGKGRRADQSIGDPGTNRACEGLSSANAQGTPMPNRSNSTSPLEGLFSETLKETYFTENQILPAYPRWPRKRRRHN